MRTQFVRYRSRVQVPPVSTPVGFISDVHGNLAALEAVLEDFRAHDVQQVFVGGDLVLGGEAPLETWRRLERAGCRCVKGLSDKALVEVDPDGLSASTDEEQARLDAFRNTRKALGELVLQQLRHLPETIRIPLIDGSEALLCHGSPADITLELSHDLSDDEMRIRLAGDPADIVFCGSSHVPFTRQIEEQRVVNVGTVGEPPEAMRVAHYAVLRPHMGGPEILQTVVEY